MLNQGWTYRDRLGSLPPGTTVLDYYAQRYRHSTRQMWRDRILDGQIHLNDKPTTPETQLEAGQCLTYHRPPWDEPEVPLRFDRLDEDEDILLLGKPSGLPVLPGAGFLQHTLWFQLQQTYPEIAPIHRLGRGTSGIMVWGKSPQGRSQLNQQLRRRQMLKVYRAWVGDWSHGDRLTIKQPIGKLPHPTLGSVYGATSNGRWAESQVEVLTRSPEGVLLEVRILTGRPHQIRIHLAAVGHPLVGDPLYSPGGELNLTLNPETQTYPVPGDCGYFLHSFRLGFHHPTSGDWRCWDCPPPDRLK
ncbi:RluA family pseudouridine synthase [Phormidium yuhuli AB48]|uniref:Pseudouridine synthase n=1 Tax=Phormidium yuhuli AB48 TaxID=2940671 RepID=A0ABY5ARD5_9CYAN|nr:RluA family pseudouridine synthase [Phormidium yuhuli]USR90911.1 RluA family pseudouridine synthase [Phormidium yuhuli AB48]